MERMICIDPSTAAAQLKLLMETLALVDWEVATRLSSQNINPQFFAFRWTTLLLSQELSLPGTRIASSTTTTHTPHRCV